jgi:hypothetical protein
MGLDLAAFNELAEVETEPDQTIIERLRFDDALEVPHQLTDVDVWLNYCWTRPCVRSSTRADGRG